MAEIGIGEFSRRSRLSLKALRLYDEREVLAPARVDQGSGYRYYDTAQLEAARLVVMLRQLEVPLAVIRELLGCEPDVAAKRVEQYWREAEAAHDQRRALADYVVSRLSGKRSVMYEVAVREIPERSLLCIKRNVSAQERWAFGKAFIGILRELRGSRPRPRIEGREGAFFCIWWGVVSADSDGPLEWCTPVPPAEAGGLARRHPELALRTEPAHREAFVALPDGPPEQEEAQWQLAVESLDVWAAEQERAHAGQNLALTPDDLGMRVTYLASALGTSEPYRDMAIPFAVAS